MSKTTIAIFVSGSGTNCENIIRHYQDREDVEVGLVVSNREDAYALVRAKKHNVPTEVLTRTMFGDEHVVTQCLERYHVNFIVLAGFLLLVPEYLIKSFPRRMADGACMGTTSTKP